MPHWFCAALAPDSYRRQSDFPSVYRCGGCHRPRASWQRHEYVAQIGKYHLGKEVTEEDIQAIMTAHDIDGGKTISLSEFTKMMLPEASKAGAKNYQI